MVAPARRETVCRVAIHARRGVTAKRPTLHSLQSPDDRWSYRSGTRIRPTSAAARPCQRSVGRPRRGSADHQLTGAKTNEPACARDLLETLDIEGSTVTADALHTVKATAELIRSLGGQFVFPVKENRRALFGALDALPWPNTPIADSHTEVGHGRITRRTIRVLPAPQNLPFPHVNQVWLIERHVTDTTGAHLSAAAQLGVASHTPEQATPAHIAAFNQGHWAIESLHWIRGTCYREDHSRVRTRSGPRVLASMRNLAVNALRLAGRRDITEATRWVSRNMTRPFIILGITA